MTTKQKGKRVHCQNDSVKTGIELFLFDNDDIKMIFIIIHCNEKMNFEKEYKEE